MDGEQETNRKWSADRPTTTRLLVNPQPTGEDVMVPFFKWHPINSQTEAVWSILSFYRLLSGSSKPDITTVSVENLR